MVAILIIIINASQRVQDALDDNFEVIKRYTGEPFEIYRHIQNVDNTEDYMDIIVSGLAYPAESIISMSNHYKALKNKLNAGSNSFGDIFANIEFDEDDEFNMDVRKINNPDDVAKMFKELTSPEPKEESPKVWLNNENIVVGTGSFTGDEY
jgi:hypothetical protein